MPLLFLIEIVLQIICAVHAVRTGRSNWLFIIVAFPLVGVAAYFFAEMLPDIRHGRRGTRAAEKVLNTLDPNRQLKQAVQALKTSDNIDNRLQLADECMAAGLYEDAIQHYRHSLAGIYTYEPNIMLKLAQAYFQQDDFQQARAVLDDLIAHNPDFKSQEGHLLYALSLENLGEIEAAEAEYTALVQYYSGYEAKCRYALLLKKHGETEKAHALFQHIFDKNKKLPSHLRALQREWIDIARSHL